MNERDGNGDVATLVANLRGMSFQYKLHVGELPDESEMVLLSDLADAGKAREVAQVFHAHYGTPRLRFAGSLSFQRCAHRLVGIVVGTYPRLWNRWWMPSVPELGWGVPTFMAM